MTEESEPDVKRQKRISPLARANKQAFKAARVTAEKASQKIDDAKEIRNQKVGSLNYKFSKI